jgi:hypothetical protein
MNLSHYSAKPLGELQSVFQAPGDPRGWMFTDKPQGLWVSVDGDDDWPSYCQNSNFNLDKLAVRHRITLKEPDRLLWLKGRPAVEEFQAEYGVQAPIVGIKTPAIDWGRVAARHAGIIIAPYVWSLRMAMMWYYTWDCASGCIWDTSVIDSVHIEEAAA